MTSFRNATLLLAGLVFVLSGCAKPAPEFSTFTKPEVDFSRFKSYQWQEARPETAIMQAQKDIMHRMIVQTTEEELHGDGLKKSEKGDLIVSYRVTVSPQKSFWQSLFAAESVTPGTYNQRSAEAQASAVDERKFKQGVLVIEMSDRNSTVVWSGRVSVILSDAQPGKAVEAVRKIMAGYPSAL
jgi:hypothetical protein